MTPSPHSRPWYDRLATMQTGYWYPWPSTLGKWNGEDEYLTLVDEQLGPDVELLDIACGHGAVALELAERCRSVVAYDRIASWIERAQATAQKQHVTNVTYLCHDSSLDANGGVARLPGDENSYDLLICRRGPWHWVEDAPRVARPGATLIMLVPDNRPLPVWNDLVPEPLRWKAGPDDPHWARKSFDQRFAQTGIRLHSWWDFDVPETFATPEDFYTLLAWGYAEDEVPDYAEATPALERIFAEFAGSDGLEIRHVRHLWKAVVPSK
ncbi:MAG: class I SAM-dependent methyltransferase [Caldilineaceae bacterium]|nr:class I SAM-dependent methyltransferase [Caldilineaceae bacterium]